MSGIGTRCNPSEGRGRGANNNNNNNNSAPKVGKKQSNGRLA